MDSPLFFEDVEVGQVWISPRRTITEADVVNFAAATGDFNPLHIDHEYAAQSHYRRPIAHGLLGLAWVAGLGSNSPNMNTIAFTSVQEWKFSRPLYFGDTVFVETSCLKKESTSRRTGTILWHRKLINQSNLIAQEGIFETLVAMEHALPRAHFDARAEQQRSSESGSGGSDRTSPEDKLGPLQSRSTL